MEIQQNLTENNIEKQVAILAQENSFYKTEISFLQTEIAQLKEQLNWFQRQIFGKKSERIISDLNQEQMTFDGFENLPVEEQKKIIPAHERCKPNRNGQDKITLPSDLPVETSFLETFVARSVTIH